ncbi:MAG TPA: hypothetical protein VFV17_04470 [Usitatibacteraceae bacterium]|nr:hypothetical protein [Usitatibacteraceae bacterium]
MKPPVTIVRDAVDEQLKRDAERMRANYIDDAGFTLRVLDALPSAHRLTPAARALIPLACSALAAIGVVLFAGGGNFLIDAVMDIATGSMTRSAIGFIAIATLFAGAAHAIFREA